MHCHDRSAFVMGSAAEAAYLGRIHDQLCHGGSPSATPVIVSEVG
jgi:hypothetical protein